MKKRKNVSRGACAQEVVFRAALEPLEASVLPAKECRRYDLLPMIRHAWEATERMQNQRAKIWVR